MAAFLLVHGSWQGAWCWSQVRRPLEAKGHLVSAIDLPAHGEDRTPIADVTLAGYADAVVQAATAFDQPAILVSHSMSGPSAAAVELAPSRFAAVIYVAGVLPPNGRPMFDLVDQYDPAFRATLHPTADGLAVRIDPDGAREFLYGLSPRGDVDAAICRLQPEPVAPFTAPVVVDPGRGGAVPAYYIETLQDRAVPLRLQRSIQAHHGFRRVLSIDSDHSPFLSAPEALAAAACAIASDL
jgi:pimeloyl-ACP methyl ester carboxylesterase